MEKSLSEIDAFWQQKWADENVYSVNINSSKPKYYVLDMFPYPSGAGLHVGHPLGYIASDIIARYKTLKGFNVLHPMGFDSFGLPAEQYAIQTGQHPALTTEKNSNTYKRQLGLMGFNYDWAREVNTSDPSYYRWTQWIFLQLFNAWYNLDTKKAEHIDSLIHAFETNGSKHVNGFCESSTEFNAEQWLAFSEAEQQQILMNYRLAYQDYASVNWCEALGTVLANDEVKDGLSERGGHPVEKRQMRQWFLRITAYAERLLKDLEKLDWSDAMKEMQRNWIGKSSGASLSFKLDGFEETIDVFTTRPDTIFGVSFLVLAPEHAYVPKITTAHQKEAVEHYVNIAKNRSERERQSEVKRISGVFTGAYGIHPFTGEKIPVWIGDYVLAGYGTGAVMAVPAGDQRDYDFAKFFNLPIPPILEGIDISEKADPSKDAILINSYFLNGMTGNKAMDVAIKAIEKNGFGKGKIQYRLRDAGFSRQRYWGEPFPIIYKNGIAYGLDESELPLTLPEVQSYQPSGAGESPLAGVSEWVNLSDGSKRETDTMPGYAGSSWYFLRYMDPQNQERFVGKEAENYWQDVDVYIGGTEHAVGHLMYARFWQKVLFDLGFVSKNEPFKKLINQGMILGMSAFAKVFQFNDPNSNTKRRVLVPNKVNDFLVDGVLQEINYPIDGLTMSQVETKYVYELTQEVHNKNQLKYSFLQDVEFPSETLIGEVFNQSDLAFIKEIVGSFIDLNVQVEKMSKSKYNVVNPDDIVMQYGADTLRMYEMFLGPLEQAKPWNTNGIEGVYRFFNKLWRLFFKENDVLNIIDEVPNEKELRALHKLIKKVEDDIEQFSFNTSVSSFMICVNELSDLKCNKKAILHDLLIVLSPYAPHISEEIWHACGFEGFVVTASWPKFNPQYLVASSVNYPISFNGKTRFNLEVAADMPAAELEKLALEHEEAQKWLEGKSPKKVIVVPGRIVNVVV
jgi:leucyl-tRNA synthetase